MDAHGITALFQQTRFCHSKSPQSLRPLVSHLPNIPRNQIKPPHQGSHLEEHHPERASGGIWKSLVPQRQEVVLSGVTATGMTGGEAANEGEGVSCEKTQHSRGMGTKLTQARESLVLTVLPAALNDGFA